MTVRLLGGNFALLSGWLIVVIAVTAYRRGERWAWYALWILPVHAVLDLTIVSMYRALSPAAILWDGSLLLSTLLAQALSYQMVFRTP